MEPTTNVEGLKANRDFCKTCPFKPNKHGYYQMPDVAARAIEQCGFDRQQVCHGTEGPNRKATSLCRGHRDYLLQLFFRLGWIEAETDEAFEKAMTELNLR